MFPTTFICKAIHVTWWLTCCGDFKLNQDVRFPHFRRLGAGANSAQRTSIWEALQRNRLLLWIWYPPPADTTNISPENTKRRRSIIVPVNQVFHQALRSNLDRAIRQAPGQVFVGAQSDKGALGRIQAARIRVRGHQDVVVFADQVGHSLFHLLDDMQEQLSGCGRAA